MTRNTLLIALALIISLFAFGCGGDDENDNCYKFCEKFFECDPDNASPVDECKADCDDETGDENDEEVSQECEDAANAFSDCYLNLDCDDFNALTTGGNTDACSAELAEVSSACSNQ